MSKKAYTLVAIAFFAASPLLVAQQPAKKLQLEDVVASTKFRPAPIEDARSMYDGNHYTILEGGSLIIRYAYTTGLPVDTLFSLKKWPVATGIDGYEFNANENKLLLATNQNKIYRHSFMADYYVFDLKAQSIVPLSKKGAQRLATFSPAGDKVAFVRQNNIFVANLTVAGETQLTADGEQNKIINGAPDWVYEEEFGFISGFEWSPDGQKLAFMRFDESQVKEFTLPIYNNLYPSLYTYKYPKAGETNATVSVLVYDFVSRRASTMDTGNEKDQYIPRIKWTADPNVLGIVRLNRLQNKLELLLANAQSGKTKIAYTGTDPCFIPQVTDHTFHFLSDREHFLAMSDRDGFNHLYLYRLNGKMANRITSGNFDVDELLGIDESNGTIYYTSTEVSPLERHIYSVRIDGTHKKQLSAQNGFNHATFSNNYKYYTQTWSNANTPPEITLNDSTGKEVRVLEDNKGMRERIVEYGFSTKEFITIPVADGQKLNAYMIKPGNFDPTRKYPVFISVYGGPQSQEVTNSWDARGGWLQVLAQQGYIVVCADNRGTDGRGAAFKKCTYMQLGKLETGDQLNTARYLATLPYIDSTRMGIFGWSYGGYMVASCLTKGSGLFKIGIAVAPVTNWRFYDSVYTERFMRTPQENPSGYDDNSPINHAGMLKGKLLLIHGSADDNVHLQNSMEFSEKLIQAGIAFDMAIYPDKNHSIYGGGTRLHLYKKMTDFVLQNL